MIRVTLAILFAAPAWGQTTPAAPKAGPQAPAVAGQVRLSFTGGPSLAVKPDEAEQLDVGKFGFITVLDGYAGEVTWEVIDPAGAVKSLEMKAGGFVLGTRQGTAEPDEHYPPEGKQSLYIRGKADGVVSALAIGVIDGRAKVLAKKTLTVGRGTGPPKDPPPVTPPVTPPVDPPVDPPAKPGYYFMVIRADGPADAAFIRAMADPAWGELRQAGHAVKDFTVSDARRLGTELRQGSPLPCVLTLQVSADGKRSTVVRDTIALPSTPDAIRKLPEGVK